MKYSWIQHFKNQNIGLVGNRTILTAGSARPNLIRKIGDIIIIVFFILSMSELVLNLQIYNFLKKVLMPAARVSIEQKWRIHNTGKI